VHWTGTVHCPVSLLAPALTLRELSAHCSYVSRPLNSTVALVSAFRDRGGGSLGRRVKMSPRAPAQMGRCETEREGGKKAAGAREREVEIPRPSCSSRAQVGCACSRGLQASTREGSERPHASACPVLFPARPTLCKRALVLPFIGVRRGSRCTMGGVAEC
jgi:hypothetical protein